MHSAIIFVAVFVSVMVAATEGKHIVCYFGSWATYRPGAGKFEVEDINPSLCTHLIYTFVGLNAENNDIQVLDPWQDLPDDYGHNGFGRFTKLRRNNTDVKFLVSIGGWNEESTKYSQMVSKLSSRREFIENAIRFVKNYEFDGFDLAWEYPGQRGGSRQDVDNYVYLVKEMREAFDEEGLLLTAAVAATKSSASKSYKIREISKHLHLINLMAYDLHGSWESHTGLNAPLLPAGSDNFESTVEACVQYWLSEGADPEKLVLGVATYGRTFRLADPRVNEIGAPSVGPGKPGPYTRSAGSLGYNEICELIHHDWISDWTAVYDEARHAPYAFYGDQWVGFDDPWSVKEKAESVIRWGLGGAMVWSIETDDFRGHCGETWPLLRQLNRVLRNSF